MASLRNILLDSVLRVSKGPLIRKWNRPPVCPHCGQAIKKKDITGHLLTHVRSKVQHCDSCIFGFSNERFMRRHIAKHVEEVVHQNHRVKRPSNLRRRVKQTRFFKASLKRDREWCDDSGSETEIDLPARQCRKRSSYCEVDQNFDVVQDDPKPPALNNPTKCFVCERVFSSSDTLSRHMVVHTNELPYKCALCLMRFSNKDALADHMPVHMDETGNKCDICGKSYASKSALKRHFLQIHKVRHRCGSCKKSFNSEKGLKIHLRISTCKKFAPVASFKCVQYNEAFERLQLLSKHAEKHKSVEEPIEECLVCGEGFNTKAELEKHLTTHSLKLPPSIDLTADGLVMTGEKGTLDKSVTKNTSVQNGSSNVIDLTDDTPGVSAVTSNISFQVPIEIKPQVDMPKVEDPDKSFICIICGKGFTRNSRLTEHMMLHTGERPFTCPECGKGFRVKHRLTEHMMMHTGERPYRCHICNAGFKVNHLYVKHMSSHAGEKPFKCTVCGESFNLNRELMAHVETHNGYIPIRCSVCGVGIPSNEDIVAHMATHSQQIGDGLSKQVGTFNGAVPSSEMANNDRGAVIGLNMNQNCDGNVAATPPELAYKEMAQHDRDLVAGFSLNRDKTGNVVAITPEISHKKVLEAFIRANPNRDMALNGRGPDVGSKLNKDITGNVVTASPEIPPTQSGAFNRLDPSRNMAPSDRSPGAGLNLDRDIPGNVITISPEMPHSTQSEAFNRENPIRGMDQNGRVPVEGPNLNKDITGNVLTISPETAFSKAFEAFSESSRNRDESPIVGFKRNNKGIVTSIRAATPYICKICGEQFSSTNEFSAHMAMHEEIMARINSGLGQKPAPPVEAPSEERVFECFVCGEDFFSDFELSVHMKKHSEEMTYKTPDPVPDDASMMAKEGSNFSVPSNLKGPPYPCNLCDDLFGSIPRLELHLQKHSGVKPFKCTLCDKAFFTNPQLIKHNLVHNPVKPFKCSECDKAFTSSYKLKEHMMVHTDERPFSCTICGNAYRTNRYLTKHMLKHNEGLAYQCMCCGQGFQERQRLKDHLVQHTGVADAAYDCRVCGRGYTRGVDLANHMKSHANDKIKPYCCIVCGKGFTNENALTQHIKFKHTVSKPMAPVRTEQPLPSTTMELP